MLAAAVRARAEEREVSFHDLIESAEAELRKLGRQLPIDLRPNDNGAAGREPNHARLRRSPDP